MLSDAAKQCNNRHPDHVPYGNRKGAPLAALMLRYRLDHPDTPLLIRACGEAVRDSYGALPVATLLARIHTDGMEYILSSQNEAAASAVSAGATTLPAVKTGDGPYPPPRC